MAAAPKSVKTYDLPDFKRDPTLPSGIWDPMWQKPEVGTRVARQTYQQMRYESVEFGEAALSPEAELADYPKKRCEVRTFSLAEVQTFEGSKVQLRCGSVGEVFKRYTFGTGTGKPPVNFHAQALQFGVDSDGRWFVKATVGRVDGGWGTKAALVVRFVGKDGKALGGAQWSGELDPPRDVPVLLLGKDAALAAKFGEVKEAAVTLFADPGK